MDRLTALLQEQFGATVANEFQRQAVYNHTMDFLEYVNQDTTVVADRVDDFLTVLRDADSRELIGFRLKGFGHAFHTVIKQAMQLEAEDFDPIIFMLTSVFTDFGNKFFSEPPPKDERRSNAYKQALQMAKQHRVSVPEELIAA